MLIEELGKLTEQDSPQTLDELFTQSKDGMMIERVRSAIFSMLPELKNSVISELRAFISSELSSAVANIKVRDGNDGKTPVKGIDYRDGVDGKDAEVDEEKLISIIFKKVMDKIPPLSIAGSRKQGGGGTSFGTPEYFTGTAGGTNTISLSYTPTPGGIIFVQKNGAYQSANNGDFSIVGNVITMTNPFYDTDFIEVIAQK